MSSCKVNYPFKRSKFKAFIFMTGYLCSHRIKCSSPAAYVTQIVPLSLRMSLVKAMDSCESKVREREQLS